MRSPGRPPRLLMVGPNVDAAARQLGGEPADVLEWVTLHETTHAAHFAAAPWLRGHLGVLTGELLAGADVETSAGELLSRARGLLSTDPRATIARMRAGDPVSLLAPAAARATIAEVQATMAAIEGYAEHVMDAAAGDLGPVVPELRAAMERRREHPQPAAPPGLVAARLRAEAAPVQGGQGMGGRGRRDGRDRRAQRGMARPLDPPHSGRDRRPVGLDRPGHRPSNGLTLAGPDVRSCRRIWRVPAEPDAERRIPPE